jgi:hypothetical protein
LNSGIAWSNRSVKGTGAGWDSILYRVFIIGGLIGIIAVAVGTSILFDPQGRTMLPVYAGGGCATLFLVGILVYWWAQFLFAGYGDARRKSNETEVRAPEISSLKSWYTLFEAMVAWGGDWEAMEVTQKQTRNPMLEWFGWATVLALFPLVNVWLYLFGVLSQETFLRYIRPAIVVLAVLMLVRTYFLMRGADNASDEETIFAPLGLRLVEKPKSRSAPKILEGQRHGRGVHIRVKGRHCITQVSGAMPIFEVETKEGKFLLTEELPQDVYTALKGLRKAKRWAGVKLAGGPDGVTVERDARGLNLWLYDLWLAERLLGENA